MGEVIKALAMSAVIVLEWWLMQPYHEPVVARFWAAVARFWRQVAEAAGWLALDAEDNYYTCVQAGL